MSFLDSLNKDQETNKNIESYTSGSDINDEQDKLYKNFCRDDIYATFLRTEYIKNNSQGGYSRRNRGRVRRSREVKANHFAASVLEPRSEYYYGAIPIVINPQVEFWINYFKTKGKPSFLKWLSRGEALKATLYPKLRQEGMPLELFYLSMIESGFNNRAYSSARAAGPWQFISGTARMYGLKMNYWVDERRDPVKATIAAATFLKDLYKRFGDWYLAMAAYNAGPGKVNYAIRRVRSRDFWKLSKSRYLRSETKNYVPKMLAALVLGSSPKKHGFEVNAYPNDDFPTHFSLIKEPAKLIEIAHHLEVPIRTLKKWNPELKQGITPPKSGPEGYPLRIPKILESKLKRISPLLSKVNIKDVHLHRVGKGDTLGGIARRYKVSLRKILAYNRKITPRRLRIGKKIAIPIPSFETIPR